MKDSIRLTAFGLRKVAFMGNIFYLHANTCYKWIFIFILQSPALHPLYRIQTLCAIIGCKEFKFRRYFFDKRFEPCLIC